MCGIVGCLSPEPIDRAVVEGMRDTLAHRGPDHAGVWMSDDGLACFGHRRLSIVDPAPESNQPFVSHDGRFVIVFNGEIYNFKDLRGELTTRGVRFRTSSDTEVLLEAYRVWGQRCLDKLSGMFAFAIWDGDERRLFCARDRVGEKPFYYAIVRGNFVFASELKALVQWPGFQRDIDYTALADFLYFGFVPDPKSIWKVCHKLPPGHHMQVDFGENGFPQVRDPSSYWDMEFAPDHSVDDWSPRILETLQGAAKEMSFADVPVGAFLSGGVDSSSVTAALSRAGAPARTFTIGFEDEGYDERPWAREVSRLYGTPHTERVVGAEDVESVIDQMTWHYDEPFNDYSYLPTYYLCREARKDITVALSGDGGDELFCGYTKYRRLAVRQAIDQFLPAGIAQPMIAAAARVLPGSRLGYHGASPVDMMANMLNTGVPLSAIRKTARGPLADTLADYSPVDTVTALLERAPPRHVGVVNAMRYLDLKLTLAGDMLVKIDRASMAVSLEVRPVFLHRDMLALAGAIPPERLASRGDTKMALKSAVSAWLPDSVLNRRKQGFAMPLGRWMDGDLAHMIGTDADDGPLNELLDQRTLLTMADADGLGREKNPASVKHSVLFLGGWLDKWC